MCRANITKVPGVFGMSYQFPLFFFACTCAVYGQELGPAPTAPPSEINHALPEIFPHVSASAWLDTSSRAAVQTSYNGSLTPSATVPMNWTGSINGCVAGATAQAYQDAVALRVNWFRSMAGVPPGITLNATFGGKDQQAALMFSANNALSHSPPSNWTCYTADAATAAGSSNICIGFFNDPGCIALYMQDFGSGNSEAGHRRWILYPQTQSMGTGDVSASGGNNSANGLWVFDGNYGTARPATRDAFVAWPPNGYVPYQVVWPRWSFSYPSADFTAATVTMTRNGSSVPVALEPIANGYGENTLVWVTDNLNASLPYTPSPPGSDTVNAVTISNVMIGGASHTFNYQVIVFDPAQGGPPAVPLVGINTPGPWSVVSGTVNVSGWALNTSGSDYTPIASVQVSVDGSVPGSASYGLSAAAACATQSSPACPNVGFSFLLDTSTLAGGIHRLHVVATDSDSTPDSSYADSTFLVAGTSGSSDAGHPGVVWQDPVTGTSEIWLLGGAQGTAVIGAANLNTTANSWRIVGMADFDGDGHPDVVWQDPVTGRSQVWFLGGAQGTTRMGAAVLSGVNSWRIAAVADFNGDGHPDLVWQDPVTGQSQVWYMGGAQGTTLIGSAVLHKPNSWRIVGAADFNGDGLPDLVWQDPVTGQSQVWFMGGTQGTTLMGAVVLSKPNAWRIARVMDFNGDGHPDLIWQDPATGRSQAWLLGGIQGATITVAVVLTGPTPLHICP